MKLCGIVPDKHVCPEVHCNRPFGVASYGDTWHSQIGGFLLDPAGICNHNCSSGLQRKKLNVGHRLCQFEICCVDTKFTDSLASSRMYRENDAYSSACSND